jgi:flagellar biosynthesis/type III secretory pathway protein FliH
MCFYCEAREMVTAGRVVVFLATELEDGKPALVVNANDYSRIASMRRALLSADPAIRAEALVANAMATRFTAEACGLS